MLISRPEYINKLKSWRDTDLIKIVTGLRRSGKSTLFTLFIEDLKKDGISSKNILQLNLDDPANDFSSYKDLYNYIKDRIPQDQKTYVFLDEVQNVPEFERAVEGLYLDKNIDLYITGSNAFLLSSELATLFSGRYIEIKMLPLSFKEYSTAFPDIAKDDLFLQYLRYGGLPATVDLLKDNKDIDLYFDGIFSTIVMKDILSRSKNSNQNTLQEILEFIYDSVGSPVSANKISNTLSSKGKALLSNHTADHYIDLFMASYLIYKAERFDTKGKNILARDYKYYAVDTGLRNYLLGKKSDTDIGHLLENVVYLELYRRGYQVFVGKADKYEIDFVAKNRDGLEYYQVALSTWGEGVLNREVRPLSLAEDNYPKYLLTLDKDLGGDIDGIRKVNIIDWLLDESIN